MNGHRGRLCAELCDFGLARVMPDPERTEVNPEMTPRIGPPKYRAPEVVKRRDYGVSSDIYGFGIMCQQLVGQLKKSRRRAMRDDVDWVLDLGDECTREPSR